MSEPERTPIAERLLLLFGYLAGAILILAMVLTALLALFQPEADITGLTRLLSTQLSLIIGAVLGYAAHPNKPCEHTEP